MIIWQRFQPVAISNATKRSDKLLILHTFFKEEYKIVRDELCTLTIACREITLVALKDDSEAKPGEMF